MSAPLKLKLEFLPPPTRALFERLAGERLLDGLLLVGGSALALQIGHRLSEDLDFAVIAPGLPSARLDTLMAMLEAEGRAVSLVTPQSRIEVFRINTGRKLLDYVRDYAVDGAKLTFFAAGTAAPPAQMSYLANAPRAFQATGFAVLGIEGLFVMKALLLANRVRSRDLFDLMVLIREHGFRLADAFHLVRTLAPIEQRDIERHKAVMTGLIPLDADDEGFEGIGLAASIDDIYAFFDIEVDRFERELALTALRRN